MGLRYFAMVASVYLISPTVFAANACDSFVAAYYASGSQVEYSANGEKALTACASVYPNFPSTIISACDNSPVDNGRNLQSLQCKLDAYKNLGQYFP